MGRLWQTLLLSHWQLAFAWLPVESLIHRQQAAYYQALNDSTAATDCAPFIRFMLECSDRTLQTTTPQDSPQVESLLRALTGEMARQEMQAVLGLVEMTLPDKPNSRNQRYRLTGPGLQKRAALQDGSYR